VTVAVLMLGKTFPAVVLEALSVEKLPLAVATAGVGSGVKDPTEMTAGVTACMAYGFC